MRSTLLVLALFVSHLAAAQEHHHHTAPAPIAAPSETHVADVPVQTQDGRSVRFYSDLVKGRVTAVNFIFTSCTTVCPLMGVRFAQLQPLLPQDVSLISVSIDPTVDTPERLAAWSRRVGAKPEWTLVTGAKPEIDTLLRSLGTTIADPASHTPLVLIIDDRGAKPNFRRLDGLTDSKTLAKILAEVTQ